MCEDVVFVHTTVRRMDARDSDATDVDEALRDEGLASVADRHATSVGIGVLHHRWAASRREWRRLVWPGPDTPPPLVAVVACVVEQAMAHRHPAPRCGAGAVADALVAPLAHVERLLASAGYDARAACGWPNLAGFAAVEAGLGELVPDGLLIAGADDLALLAGVDPRGDLHEIVLGPAPGGACRVALHDPDALATRLLVAAPRRDHGAAAARLAARLDALVTWQPGPARPPSSDVPTRHDPRPPLTLVPTRCIGLAAADRGIRDAR